MLARYIKASSEKILLPISKKVPNILTPNHLSFFGSFLNLVVGTLFGLGKIQLAGFLLLVAGFFDLLDGAYARFHGQAKKFGAFWDSVLDRYSDLFIIGGIIFYFARAHQLTYVLLSILTLAGFVTISYAKARAENIIKSCDTGLMERPERILALSAGSILNSLKPTMWILTFLCHQTAIQRIWHTYRQIKYEETKEKTARITKGEGTV